MNDNRNVLGTIADLATGHGIERDFLLNRLRLGLQAAYTKFNYNDASVSRRFRVEIEDGCYTAYIVYDVVDDDTEPEEYNPDLAMTVSEARVYDPEIEAGLQVRVPLAESEFCQTAHDAVPGLVEQAERESVFRRAAAAMQPSAKSAVPARKTGRSTKSTAKSGRDAGFFEAIDDLIEDKGLNRDYILEKIRTAMQTSFKRYNHNDPVVADRGLVVIDEENKRIEMYVITDVVADDTPPEEYNPDIAMTVSEAKKFSRKAAPGMQLHVPVDMKEFGRIAAGAAKQVIVQAIREAERGMVYDEFTSREHEILTGEVSRIDPRNDNATIKVSSNSEYTEALLTKREQMPNEVLVVGKVLRVYVIEVLNNTTRGPQVKISRTHPGLVKRLFELEVPEIADGTVEIRSIAREAGSRTKMAVSSNASDVDPIGACVGPKGGRVNSIVEELCGEKIDIVRFSEVPEEYIAAALSPADVISVSMDADGKSCRVIVPDNQLSLAIGKEGQNARLAAKLTGFKIDIKAESEG